MISRDDLSADLVGNFELTARAPCLPVARNGRAGSHPQVLPVPANTQLCRHQLDRVDTGHEARRRVATSYDLLRAASRTNSRALAAGWVRLRP